MRAALKNLRFRYGGWNVLAGVMGIHVGALSKIAHRHWPVTAEVLLRACKAGGLSVDAMLNESLSDTGRCRSCGAMRRVG